MSSAGVQGRLSDSTPTTTDIEADCTQRVSDEPRGDLVEELWLEMSV